MQRAITPFHSREQHGLFNRQYNQSRERQRAVEAFTPQLTPNVSTQLFCRKFGLGFLRKYGKIRRHGFQIQLPGRRLERRYIGLVMGHIETYASECGRRRCADGCRASVRRDAGDLAVFRQRSGHNAAPRRVVAQVCTRANRRYNQRSCRHVQRLWWCVRRCSRQLATFSPSSIGRRSTTKNNTANRDIVVMPFVIKVWTSKNGSVICFLTKPQGQTPCGKRFLVS